MLPRLVLPAPLAVCIALLQHPLSALAVDVAVAVVALPLPVVGLKIMVKSGCLWMCLVGF